MAEYIEREALIYELNKLSDECEYYGEWEDCISSYESNLLDIVEKVPAADVQEVVHCYNCKYADIQWQPEKPLCRRLSHMANHIMTMPSDGFCSYGEKRGEQE